MTMNCLPNQRSERANQKHPHEPAFRNASNVERAGPIPSRLVCETNLSEGRDRKIPGDVNQKSKKKSKTKRKTSMKAPKNAIRPVADAMNFEIKRLGR